MIDHLCSLLIFIACCSSAGQTLAAASGSISHWFEPPFRGGLLPAGLGESTVAGGSPPLNGGSSEWLIEPLAVASVCPVELQQAMKMRRLHK